MPMKIKTLLLLSFCICAQFGALMALENGNDWLRRGIKEADYQEKVKCFEKAIELNPGLVDAHYRLGLAYRDIGELNKAERAFNAALRASPDNVDNSIKLNIIYELGMTYVKLRKHNYAKEALQYALNIAPRGEMRCNILYELSKIYLTLEDFDRAISSLEEGIEANPKNLASFKTAIDNARRSKQLHTNYKEGLTNFQQGFYSEAVEAFAKVVKIDPNFRDAADKLYQSQIRLSRLNDKLMATEQRNRSSRDHSQPDERKTSTAEKADSGRLSYNEESNNERNSGIRKSGSNSDDQYLDQLYEQGMSALRNDRWRTALKNFKKIQEMNPNYRDISSLIMEARLGMESVQELEQVSKFYNQALEEFEKGEWLKAIVEFEKAKMLYP
ncbi:tetratricopeptide repeat protein, partial [candidate division KSB1 bacterium]|nr:tetratricopeptide repeat protein [candidate division KSB1 bacterium]